MNKLIRNILLFCILPALIFAALEITIHRKKNDLFSEVSLNKFYAGNANDYKWLSKIKNDSLILLTGSSSVRYGISCSILNQLSKDKYGYANLGMDARDALETYFILKNLDLKKVKQIYFGLDPWIYTKRFYGNKKGYMYMDYTLAEMLKYDYNIDPSSFKKRYKYLSLFLLNGSPERVYAKTEIPDDYGSVELKATPKNFNEPILNYFEIEKYNWSDLQFQYLFKIQEMCKSNKIDFILFVPPKAPEFTHEYKKQCSLIHKQYVNRLISFGINAPIMGTFDQLDAVGGKQLFKEAYHLNVKGQNIYSEIFYKMMINPKVNFSTNYLWYKDQMN